MGRPVRVWAAVLTSDGEIGCDVRDAEGVKITAGDEAYRPWRFCVVEGDPSKPVDDEPGCRCVPGLPCQRCKKTAVKWWGEWATRTAARNWSAGNPETPGRWSIRDACGHKHPTRMAADRCAQASGFPQVILRNGHGAVLERHDAGAVPAGPMFGEVPRG